MLLTSFRQRAFKIPEAVRTQIQVRIKEPARDINAAAPSRPTPKVSVSSTNTTNRSKAGRRQRYQTKDIHPSLQKDWVEVLVPAAKEFVGSQENPWAPLAVDDLQVLMDKVFPHYAKTYRIEEDDVFHNVVSVRSFVT